MITFGTDAGELVLDTPDDGPVEVLGFDVAGRERLARSTRLVELAAGSDGHAEITIHSEHRSYAAARALRYVGHEQTDDRLVVVQQDPTTRLTVRSELRAQPGALEARTVVTNDGEVAVPLHYVSSLSLTGFVAAVEDWRRTQVHVGHNGWAGEFRWRALPLEDVGLVAIGYPGSMGMRSRYALTGHGSWSSGDHLPMGGLTDAAGTGWVWQLESNGPWHWELADAEPDLELRLSGPTRNEHAWTVVLAPGTAFESVPVAVSRSAAGLEGALRELTRYRRATRRPHPDHDQLPVIFNDYMNALMGDPTTAKLLPLIDAAAEAGSEYFVVDAGWYTDEAYWWDLVGDWTEAVDRFPNGFGEVVDHIRARGMVPGIWLEPEVVGVRSAAASSLPPEAFFRRDGAPVVEYERYQLDLRHPAAVAHLDAAVDRLVQTYGIGYFKLDHNVNAGPGTEVGADSLGAASLGSGLLDHTRALSRWHDALLDRYPALVVENCSSGGLRVDHAQLRRLPIQSTSDQQDPVLTSAIAAAAPSALTPEQAAVWAYPQPEMDAELLALTMVNALLGRIHLSGHLDLVVPAQMQAVKEAVTAYKSYRASIAQALPQWPLGLPGWYDDVLATALETEDLLLVAVWRRGGDQDRISLPVPGWQGRDAEPSSIYPTESSMGLRVAQPVWNAAAGQLDVTVPVAPGARLVALRANS